MRNQLTALTFLIVMAWRIAIADPSGEDVTIKGEACCARCKLKEDKPCQNVILVRQGDKIVPYYLEQNVVSRRFHVEICAKPKNVLAVGRMNYGSIKLFIPTRIAFDNPALATPRKVLQVK